MPSGIHVAREAIKYVRGVSKGALRGDFFPPAGRIDPATAPGGTTVSVREGFELAEHVVPLRGLAEPMTLLQLTDVHIRGPSPSLLALAENLQRLEADVVVLTGDLVAREWTPAGLHAFLRHLPEARLGRYAVLGNWEHWVGLGPEAYRRYLTPHRVELLQNERRAVGDIEIVGVDDILAGDPDIDGALADLPPSRPVVCLTHSPTGIREVCRPPVQLVLSGHTHGGQIRLPGFGAFWVPKGSGPFISGFYQHESTLLHVCPGLGWSVAPIRLRCPPRASLFKLVPEKP